MEDADLSRPRLLSLELLNCFGINAKKYLLAHLFERLPQVDRLSKTTGSVGNRWREVVENQRAAVC